MGKSYVSCFFWLTVYILNLVIQMWLLWVGPLGHCCDLTWISDKVWLGPCSGIWPESDLSETWSLAWTCLAGGGVIWVLFCTCKMHFLLLKDHFQSSARNLLSQIVTGCSVTKTRSSAIAEEPRKMRHVSWNLANCHATVQKLLIRQVLNQVSAVADWPVRQNRAVDSAWWSVR